MHTAPLTLTSHALRLRHIAAPHDVRRSLGGPGDEVDGPASAPPDPDRTTLATDVLVTAARAGRRFAWQDGDRTTGRVELTLLGGWRTAASHLDVEVEVDGHTTGLVAVQRWSDLDVVVYDRVRLPLPAAPAGPARTERAVVLRPNWDGPDDCLFVGAVVVVRHPTPPVSPSRATR